jgi:hypothetical protein
MIRELMKLTGILPDPNKPKTQFYERPVNVRGSVPREEIELEVVTERDSAGSWETNVYRANVPSTAYNYRSPLGHCYSLTRIGHVLFFCERRAIRQARKELLRQAKGNPRKIRRVTLK